MEWNSDPEIADTAEKLYGDIEHLELYVGLQAEETKPVMDGAGLCPGASIILNRFRQISNIVDLGYTVSRAILSDAVALTRGDRFFTQDYTPNNLTAWGFNDCQRDPNGAGFGSMLGRLFLRTIPEHFTENSVYTWFPLMTPAAMKVNLEALGKLDQYNVSRPGTGGSSTQVKEHSLVAQILGDPTNFKTVYAAKASTFIKGKGYANVCTKRPVS